MTKIPIPDTKDHRLRCIISEHTSLNTTAASRLNSANPIDVDTLF
ncbi:hypothetical protein [Photobacterium carnosum]|nr:hypothetical protein [Photobacterium carnosum]